jgi:hypothetical protein
LATLLAQHYAVGKLAQLKTQLVEHVSEQLLEDDGAPLDSSAGDGCRSQAEVLITLPLSCQIALPARVQIGLSGTLWQVGLSGRIAPSCQIALSAPCQSADGGDV